MRGWAHGKDGVTRRAPGINIAHGLAELGKTRDEGEIEVVSEGSRGLFGLGAEEARVQISVIEPKVVEEFVKKIREEGRSMSIY